jgi:hypothetical protein
MEYCWATIYAKVISIGGNWHVHKFATIFAKFSMPSPGALVELAKLALIVSVNDWILSLWIWWCHNKLLGVYGCPQYLVSLQW